MGLMEEMAQLDKAGVNDTLTINKETGEVEQPKIEVADSGTVKTQEAEPAKEESTPEPDDEGDETEAAEAADDAKDDQPAATDKKAAAREGYQRRKSAREKELAERLAEAEGKLAGLMAAMQPKATEKAENDTSKAPDPNQDPDGYRDWHIQQNMNSTNRLAGELKQTKEQLLFQAARQELRDKEIAFKASKPDYDAAIEHGIQRVIRQQQLLNPQATEAQIRQQLEVERVQFAARMAHQGRDPAEGLYTLMTEVYGYAPAKADKAQGMTEAQRFETVKANKAKAASGVASGGATGIPPVSAEAVKNMTLADFAKMSADDQMRIFGSTH